MLSGTHPILVCLSAFLVIISYSLMFVCNFQRIYFSRSVAEEDEVYSVARLLGDLVAYRATGTGHLELLAGQY